MNKLFARYQHPVDGHFNLFNPFTQNVALKVPSADLVSATDEMLKERLPSHSLGLDALMTQNWENVPVFEPNLTTLSSSWCFFKEGKYASYKAEGRIFAMGLLDPRHSKYVFRSSTVLTSGSARA